MHPNRGVRFFRLNSIEAGRNLVSFIGDDVLFCQVEPVSVVEAVRFVLIDPWRTSGLHGLRHASRARGRSIHPSGCGRASGALAGLGLGGHRLCCRGCPASLVVGVGRPQAAPETCRFVKLTAVLRCLRGFSSFIESSPDDNASTPDGVWCVQCLLSGPLGCSTGELGWSDKLIAAFCYADRVTVVLSYRRVAQPVCSHWHPTRSTSCQIKRSSVTTSASPSEIRRPQPGQL